MPARASSDIFGERLRLGPYSATSLRQINPTGKISFSSSRLGKNSATPGCVFLQQSVGNSFLLLPSGCPRTPPCLKIARRAKGSGHLQVPRPADGEVYVSERVTPAGSAVGHHAGGGGRWL